MIKLPFIYPTCFDITESYLEECSYTVLRLEVALLNASRLGQPSCSVSAGNEEFDVWYLGCALPKDSIRLNCR